MLLTTYYLPVMLVLLTDVVVFPVMSRERPHVKRQT